MGAVDDVIKSVGVSSTIIRTIGNLSTWLYISPKGSFLGSRAAYEREAMVPTDSGIVIGDLVHFANDYFLVVSLFEDRRVSEFFYYKAKLYRCNETITVQAYNATTKSFANSNTGIRCLIVSSQAALDSDKGVVIPGFRGSDDVFYLYAQKSSLSGITKNSILIDSSLNKLRVGNGINPYFASGLIEVPVKMEVR